MLRSVVACLIVGSVSMLSAQSAEQEVMKVEEARAVARQKADAATLLNLMPDDHLTVGPRGQVQDRKATAALAAAPKLALADVRAQVFGDVAVVTGRQGTEMQQRFTRVWQRRNGQWTNVFGQVTQIAPAAAGQKAASVPPTQWPEGKTPDERDVIRAMRDITAAFTKKDPTAYAALTADGYLRITASGETNTKADFLKTVAATPDTKRTESSHSDFRLRTYGPIAVVTIVDKTTANASPGTRMTRIFVKEGGAWKQLVTQLTAIQP